MHQQYLAPDVQDGGESAEVGHGPILLAGATWAADVTVRARGELREPAPTQCSAGNSTPRRSISLVAVVEPVTDSQRCRRTRRVGAGQVWRIPRGCRKFAGGSRRV
jgi:hypothetical protein